MSHPILGFELAQLRRKTLAYVSHNGVSDEEYALFFSAFVCTEYVNRSVMMALAELVLAGTQPSGDGG